MDQAQSDTVKLEWPGAIRVYADEAGTDELDSGDTFGAQDNWPVKVYVEGASPTQAQGAMLTVGYHFMDVVRAEDRIAFTVAAADLRASQLGEDPEPDPDELDPGLFVALNTVENPQELQMLTLDVLSDDSVADQVRIAWTEDPKVDVFSDAQGTQPVVTEQERTFEVPDLPQVLYVEGTDHSDEVRDIDLTLEYLHDGEVLYTDLIKTTVVRVDLDMGHGGGHLGLGGTGVPRVTVLQESLEENPGAYLLVNWDNDDGASPPQPDLGKNSVTDEDNLARLVLDLEPTLEEGALTLTVDSDPAGLVKLWFALTKECEVTELGWNLAEETPPTELWVEGRTSTTLGQKVELRLAYVPPVGNTAFGDSVRATVVMINLGNVVYREAGAAWGLLKEQGHAALVWQYTGECWPGDLSNDANFQLIEMGKAGGACKPIDINALDSITEDTSLLPWGCYTNPQITYEDRLDILKMAEKLVTTYANDIGWCDEALRPKAWAAPHEVKDIKKLRCDGLVEVCYEKNGVDVWGALSGGGAPHYSILDDAYQAEHDHLGVSWRRCLVPATQGGYEHTHRGTEWETEFQKQNLCDPVGSTGGN